MHPTPQRGHRRILLMTLAVLSAVAIAACGSSSSSPSGSSSSSASAQFAKYQSCLKSHGATVPTHNFKRPSGSQGGTAATDATPPSGRSGTPPRGGFKKGSHTPPAGGFTGKQAAGGAEGKVSKKQEAAFKACATDMPKAASSSAGRGGGAAAAGVAQYSAATLKKVTACVKKNGYDLPTANTSGTGPVFPRSIESNKKFEAAAKPCQSLLRPSTT
jgi:hypothetical protein